MRTDIWKGHEDFFSRFNQQEKALQNEAESFMKNSKNESRIMEKSMKKSSSKFEKDFSSSTSDATNSDFGRSRSWLMPKGFFAEDFYNKITADLSTIEGFRCLFPIWASYSLD